jgi:hypothetical protein
MEDICILGEVWSMFSFSPGGMCSLVQYANYATNAARVFRHNLQYTTLLYHSSVLY